MAELTLRVITPDRIVVDLPADSVKVPASDGLMGILPRHAPMVAALDAGLVSYKHGSMEVVMFVSGGFAEVRDNTVRVVTMAGEKADEIDEERAREAEARARELLEDARGGGRRHEIDQLRAEAALRRALLRLRARQQRN